MSFYGNGTRQSRRLAELDVEDLPPPPPPNMQQEQHNNNDQQSLSLNPSPAPPPPNLANPIFIDLLDIDNTSLALESTYSNANTRSPSHITVEDASQSQQPNDPSPSSFTTSVYVPPTQNQQPLQTQWYSPYVPSSSPITHQNPPPPSYQTIQCQRLNQFPPSSTPVPLQHIQHSSTTPHPCNHYHDPTILQHQIDVLNSRLNNLESTITNQFTKLIDKIDNISLPPTPRIQPTPTPIVTNRTAPSQIHNSTHPNQYTTQRPAQYWDPSLGPAPPGHNVINPYQISRPASTQSQSHSPKSTSFRPQPTNTTFQPSASIPLQQQFPNPPQPTALNPLPHQQNQNNPSSTQQHPPVTHSTAAYKEPQWPVYDTTDPYIDWLELMILKASTSTHHNHLITTHPASRKLIFSTNLNQKDNILLFKTLTKGLPTDVRTTFTGTLRRTGHGHDGRELLRRLEEQYGEPSNYTEEGKKQLKEKLETMKRTTSQSFHQFYTMFECHLAKMAAAQAPIPPDKELATMLLKGFNSNII